MFFFIVPQFSSYPVNQWGSGASRYSLTETSRRYIHKFGTTGVDYLLRVEPLNVRGLTDGFERTICIDFIGHDKRNGGSRSDPFGDAFTPIEHSH